MAETLILPCIALTGVGLYDLFSTGQKRLYQNIVFISLFGPPTLLFAWLLLDKKMEFKDNEKARKAERFIKPPFSSHSTLFILLMASLLMVTGITIVFVDKNVSGGLPGLVIGLFIMVFTSIAIEHPKIWFSDTLNIKDLFEEVKNKPIEYLSAYQDGVFTYADDSFTVQLDTSTKTINWNDITLIRAYKVAQYTVDCIVIEIYCKESLISINDQTAGHMKFMETASNKLTNFKKDWFTIVAFPAFETNLTVIYERQKTSL